MSGVPPIVLSLCSTALIRPYSPTMPSALLGVNVLCLDSPNPALSTALANALGALSSIQESPSLQTGSAAEMNSCMSVMFFADNEFPGTLKVSLVVLRPLPSENDRLSLLFGCLQYSVPARVSPCSYPFSSNTAMRASLVEGSLSTGSPNITPTQVMNRKNKTIPASIFFFLLQPLTLRRMDFKALGTSP